MERKRESRIKSHLVKRFQLFLTPPRLSRLKKQLVVFLLLCLQFPCLFLPLFQNLFSQLFHFFVCILHALFGTFHPVQYVQKSVLNLYMIRKKMHLLQSKRSKSPCYAHYFALPQVEHVTLIFVLITSRVTGKCLR